MTSKVGKNTGTGQKVDPVPTHDAVQLTEGGILARIKLGDKIYVLRITRAGKLILTK